MKSIKKYGVHLNIHPSANQKRIVIHFSSCPHFKQHTKQREVRNIYSFNWLASDLRDALERASSNALEWHAPIKFCNDCFKINSNVNCDF